MCNDKKINILGGGWVTAAGFGTLSDIGKFRLAAGDPQVPKAKEVFTEPLSRYGRFDKYTRIGCAAIALALKEAAMDKSGEKRPIGVVVSSIYECFESDLNYYETTIEDDGFFSSPNLFSYTLPGIVIGESAIHFKLTGPTFTMGDVAERRGYNALLSGIDLINTDACDTVVAGWLDGPSEKLIKIEENDDRRRGGIFLVLSGTLENKNYGTIYSDRGRIITGSGQQVNSILDLMK
jgi:3-oxoacyl-(acyl-carrier-protein) synthase